MNNVGSLSEMVNSSINVMTKPSVSTFEMYEQRGTLQNALIYVGVAAIISGVLGAILAPAGVIVGALGALIGSLLGFLVFTYAVYYIGRSQGGTGTLNEVAYTFSLFSAPLMVISAVISLIGRAVPLVGCIVGLPIALVLIVAQVYFGYLAVQSSMNLRETGKAIITLVAAAILSFIVAAVIGGIFAGAALVGGAVAQ